MRGNKAGAAFIVVDEEVSFRCAGHKMDSNDENNVSFVDDGNEAVEYELVTPPAVHGTTVGARPTLNLFSVNIHIHYKPNSAIFREAIPFTL